MVRIEEYRIYTKKPAFRPKVVIFWLRILRNNANKVEMKIFELLPPKVVQCALYRSKKYLKFWAKCPVGPSEPWQVEKQFLEILTSILNLGNNGY
ncbi:MAG: hypothetical protein HWN65_05475 [Candidatus Helarchaeota archaeon]|nr:hypothetical protein [Candidatus Helarchaeota archaeon]